MALRTRLLLGLLALAAVGLLAADAVTYASLESFLTRQVDQRLTEARDPLFHMLGAPPPGAAEHGGGASGGPGGPSPVPPGTYAALVDARGAILVQITFGYTASEQAAQPRLPSPLPLPRDGTPALLTAPSRDGTGAYRVAVQAPDSNDPSAVQGRFLVVAISCQDIDATLRRLLLIEVGVGVAALAGLAALGSWAVRLGLRPLDRIAATAGAIAAGDLRRRVEIATPRTEVGRLGLALNAMLGQIERAFAARAASEDRLRRFVADASHELRTPLSSIRGYAELFRRGANRNPEDLATAMRRIEAEATRMGRLVDDLLLLARLDEGRPLERGPVDLAALAEDAAADARASAPQRMIRLVAADDVVVTGDELRLRQVVGNLVRNALVHTPAGTPVEVDVSGDGDVGVLTVADRGPGIPPGTADRIFERFYRTDPGGGRDHGGSGLGLSIVAAVVAAHAGTVHLSETPGGGATFTIRLPLFGGEPRHEAGGLAGVLANPDVVRPAKSKRAPG